MKYWNISSEKDNFWLEVDSSGVALRQIIRPHNGKIQLSCFEDCLAEETFCPHDMEGKIRAITEESFEEEWKKNTDQHRATWQSQKGEYAIGKSVRGKVLYFYPQGCIVRINNALGCVSKFTGGLKIGDEIHGFISDYDEQNMWILVSLIS